MTVTFGNLLAIAVPVFAHDWLIVPGERVISRVGKPDRIIPATATHFVLGLNALPNHEYE